MRAKKNILLAVALLLPGLALAAASNYPLEAIDTDHRDKPSLQRGMQLYMNYCVGCHSLQYQRYERTADDLAIPHDMVLDNLVFTGQAIGGKIVNAMSAEESKNWFGAPPPDLTMVTRVRSPEWVYTYLKTFYLDPARPFGVNNKVLENAGMPHVLLELQGVQEALCTQVPVTDEAGVERRDPLVPGKAVTHEECGVLVLQEGSGLLSAEEYDQAIYDIVNFLDYVAEPYKLDRQRIGVFVLLFLVVLGVFTYLLNREYWKDVR